MTLDPNPRRGARCQSCPWYQEWTTWPAATAAALWHIFDAHPAQWRAVTGSDNVPAEPAPTDLGHQFAELERRP